MKMKRRIIIAVLACVAVVVAMAAIGLPMWAKAHRRPHGFRGDNFIRHIHRGIQLYVDQTGAETLPRDLHVVSDFWQMESPKQLVSYRGVPFERIRYVGGGLATNAPPLTPVLLYNNKRKKNELPRGAVRYLNQEWDIVEGDGWLKLWQSAAPTEWD